MTFRSTLDAALAAADLHEIDAICDRFESAWRAGRRPDLASFLSEAPPGGLALLFRDLLNLDLEFRVKSGETLSDIARRELGTANRAQELAELNGIDDPTKLRAGQTLKLPAK